MTTLNQHYQNARESMVDCQIHPMGVVSDDILNAFLTTPRELFVPEGKAGICYSDEEIALSDGRFLMDAVTLARVLQAVNLTPNMVALTIGAGASYNAAILSRLCSTVFALENHESIKEDAQKAWDAIECCNIVGVQGDEKRGLPDHQPYDFILMNGAVSAVPDAIQSQLAVGRSMVAFVKKASDKLAKATVITRIDDKNFSSKILFEIGMPYLSSFLPEKEFVF